MLTAIAACDSARMKLLWRDSWIDAPRPHRVPGSTLIEVEATVADRARSARPTGAGSSTRLRKVASFTVTDGPAATLRKARSKRAEPAYTGDYHLVAVLGRAAPGEGLAAEGARVVALAPRSVPLRRLDARPRARSSRPAARRASTSAALAALAATRRPRGGAPAPTSSARATSTPRWSRPRSCRGSSTAASPGPLAAGGGGRADPRARPPTPDRRRRPRSSLGGPGSTRRRRRPWPSSAPATTSGSRSPRRSPGAGLRRAVLADREPQIAALAAAELGFAARHHRRRRRDRRAASAAGSSSSPPRTTPTPRSPRTPSTPAIASSARSRRSSPPPTSTCSTAAAAAHPGELEVGFNRRHNPLVERARREIARRVGPGDDRRLDPRGRHHPRPLVPVAQPGHARRRQPLPLDRPRRSTCSVPVPRPVEVVGLRRASPTSPPGLDAERAFSIAFDDGSTVSLVPTGRGDSIRGVQEQIEIRRGSLTLRPRRPLEAPRAALAAGRSAAGRCGATRATPACTRRRSSRFERRPAGRLSRRRPAPRRRDPDRRHRAAARRLPAGEVGGAARALRER